MCLYIWQLLIELVYCFCLYYQVRGHALDKNGAKLEEPIDLPIKVVDINDNFPVFSHEVFVGSIEELSETGNFILFYFSFIFSQDLQEDKWICTLEQFICSNKGTFSCWHKPGYPRVNEGFYSVLSCIVWLREGIPLGARENNTSSCGTSGLLSELAQIQEPELLQESHRKWNLPSGLVVTAYLGGTSPCHPHPKPCFICGLEGHFAGKHIRLCHNHWRTR